MGNHGYPRVLPEKMHGYGLGLLLDSMGIFGLGTHKVQNFGFLWVLPLGTREDWVPKIWAQRVILELYYDKKNAPIIKNRGITKPF